MNRPRIHRYLLVLLIALATWVSAANAQQEGSVAKPASPRLSESYWEQLPAHPRLFANDARVSALKLQSDDVSKNLLGLLKNAAEIHLTAKEIVYPTGRTFKFDAVRTAQGRILTLALSYRIFGDDRYLNRAKAELLQLAELPDWCPSHFIDVGEASLAAGIGLDWLYDSLTAEERAKIAQSIVRNALEPSLGFKEEEVGELNGNFNHNPVNNAGLITGALAVAELEPELARKVVERAIKFLPIAVEVYAPHGAYPEGPTYWSYGTTFHVFAVEALRSVFNNSYDLEKFPGLLESIYFIAQMRGPTGHDYNFGDATSAPHIETIDRFTSEPVTLWFARERGRREIAALEIDCIAKAMDIIKSGAAVADQKRLSRHLAFEVLWWNPELPPVSPTYALPLHWTADGFMPIAVMRSKWDDPQASYIALKGGTPNNSHGQMDIGSFILEADGIRWALDMGGESYNKMRAAKLDLWNYSQDSDRWTTFRPGPDGHNILRFNNARQDITGMAKIRRLPDEDGVVGDVADLTSLYQSQVAKVTRTVQLRPDRSMTIQDEWTASGNDVEVAFQWLTKAKITIVPTGVLLEHNGKSLQVKVEVLGSAVMPEISVEDLSKARAPQDSDNPGVGRFVIRLVTAAGSSSGWKITAIPGSLTVRE
ncbi:MAG: heparinase II/III family protein [Burkholderiales bacterium]|nr:heparinase II/III family protein [Opitutaceae bacterium]